MLVPMPYITFVFQSKKDPHPIPTHPHPEAIETEGPQRGGGTGQYRGLNTGGPRWRGVGQYRRAEVEGWRRP